MNEFFIHKLLCLSTQQRGHFYGFDEACNILMRSAMNQLQLSARAYHRILKLARTIADLAGSEPIQPAHLAEPQQYCPRMMEAG